MEWLKLVHGAAQPTFPAAFGPGDEVRVWYRIREQDKERVAPFEGTVIRVRGAGHAKTFTVRRVTYGEGVERVFPVDAKAIARVEVLRQGKVKRSRLYFLRHTVGKTRIASAGESAADQAASGRAGVTRTDRPAASETGSEKIDPTLSSAQRPAATTEISRSEISQ